MVLCSWLLKATAADGMGRKMLIELHEVSPILLEMGCWEIILGIWAIFSIFAIFPYLWQDRKALERERLLSLLWSEP